MRVREESQRDTAADDINVRFRTDESSGLLLATRDNTSTDRIEIAVNRGKASVTIRVDGHETVLDGGAGLNDGHWHTVKLTRRGRTVQLAVDGDHTKTESILSTTSILRRTNYHLGSIAQNDLIPSDYPNFSGSLQQVWVNGVAFLEMEKTHQLKNSQKTTDFVPQEMLIDYALTFRSHHTYLGLPQLKAYYDIAIHFQFRTLEPDGLIMFNSGKTSDFLAVELVEGHVRLVVNLGPGSVSLSDNYPTPLNNNQWHEVTIVRPHSGQISLLLDDYIAVNNKLQEQQTLELDGILFLGILESFIS